MKNWIILTLLFLRLNSAMCADEVGTSWRRVDDGGGDKILRVCWDGPVAVGVGVRGLICTTTDGKTWVPRFQNIISDLRAITWSGTHYVVVGNNGALLRSSNGIHWQRIETSPTYNYSGVIWTGTQFIALDNLINLSTSSDGITWSRSVVNQMGNATGIEYFEGATYVRHTSGIVRSTDLITWTPVLSVLRSPINNSIRKCNGKLFCLVANDRIVSSSDGITWTSSSFPIGATAPRPSPTDIAWNGHNYIASTNSSLVMRSVDGVEWTLHHTGGAANYAKSFHGEFVIGSTMGDSQTSLNGREWTMSKYDHSKSTTPIWTGSQYIAVGSSGLIVTSSDFKTWVTRDSNGHSNFISLIWTGSFAMIAGEDGVVLKSNDGMVWTHVVGVPFGTAINLVWTGTQTFAFSQNGVDVSNNGIDWIRVSAVAAPTFTNVKWLRGVFIGVGSNGAIGMSQDGVTWTMQISGTTSHLTSIGNADAEFFTTGYNFALKESVLLASTNGVTWSAKTFPGKLIYCLNYYFGRWFIVTDGGVYESENGLSWNRIPSASQSIRVKMLREWVWNGVELKNPGLGAFTTDGTNWQPTTIPANSVPEFNAVAKGPGGYVAVGMAGEIWHSPDGYGWQRAQSPIDRDFTALASRAGLWVAVGSGGVIVSSPNGIDWTERSSGTANSLRDVASNGQRFTAVGEQGTILISADGITWSVQPTGTTTTMPNVEASGTSFKVFGDFRVTFNSADGIVWTREARDFITDVIWNGTAYVALGNGSGGAWAHVSSPDALTWTRYPMGPNPLLTSICWNGSLYVACGRDGTITTSPDAITWTKQVSGASFNWIQSVTWNGAQFVAVGHGNTLLHSVDGITWLKGIRTGRTSIYNYEDVVWADGQYVAVGDSGGITSTNGINWQPMTGNISNNLTVDRIGTHFIAGGRNLYSATSTAWVPASQSSFPTRIYDLESNGTQLIAAMQTGIYTLTETTPGNWEAPVLVHASPEIDNMVRNGNEYVATGTSGTIVLSRDGTTWQTVKGGRGEGFVAVANNGSRFVGVGRDGLLISTDGDVWRHPVVPVNSSVLSMRWIIWDGSRFLGQGSDRMIWSSRDGETWAGVSSVTSPPDFYQSMAGDGEMLVAVGSGGMIVVSDGLGESSRHYQEWIAAQGAINGNAPPLRDANLDGISNLIAYMHGIPATGTLLASQRAALPAFSINPNDGTRRLVFELRESYRPGAIYQVEVSPNMDFNSWQSIQRHSGTWSSDSNQANVTETPLPGGGVRITLSNFPRVAADTACFFRLKAILQ